MNDLKKLNICQKQSKICILNEKHGTIYCEESKCKNDNPFDCSHNYCTKNQETCHEILKMTSLVRSMSFMHISHLKKYRDFLSGIPACSKQNVEYNPQALCFRGTKCVRSEFLITSFGLISVNQTAECPCKHDFSYQCNANFCAKSIHECNSLSFLNNYQINERFKTATKIKPCTSYYGISKKIIF